MIKRAYSIASSSKAKEFLEFYVTLVHSGSLTPRLFNLKIGDRVGVGKRFVGMFTLKEIPEEKEHTPWPGYTKFVQDMWTDGIMEDKWSFKPLPENTSIFLCGNPRMISDMVEALEKDGFIEHKKKNPGQIYIEKF